MTREEFITGFAVLSAAYPESSCTSETIEVYWAALRHLTPQEFEVAAWAHIRQYKWFPKISEILEALDVGRLAPEDLWGRLLVAAEDGVKPPLDGSAETALLAVGGWENFQVTPYSELKFMFKIFKDTYLVAVKQEKAQVALPGPGEQSGPGLLDSQ